MAASLDDEIEMPFPAECTHPAHDCQMETGQPGHPQAGLCFTVDR
jgi:hypothetical protein